MSAPPLNAKMAGGFTLIELLVTLVIVSVGLLGVAKMQAAAMTETQVSRVRSLMTYQAESLAGIMRSNRAYWAVPTNNLLPKFSVAPGGVVTDTAGTLGTSVLANNDVRTVWAPAFGRLFPNASAAVVCTDTSGPVSCDIGLTWSERYAAVNRTAGEKTGTGTLVMHVQP